MFLLIRPDMNPDVDKATDSEVLDGVTEALRVRSDLIGKALREDHGELLEKNLHLDEGTNERAYWHAGHVAGMLTVLDWIERRVTLGDDAMDGDELRDNDAAQTSCFP